MSRQTGDEAAEERPATLRTLERGLTVFEAVASSAQPPTTKMLSRQLDIKIGACYHLIRTLVEAGYLVRLPGGGYDTGPRAAALGRHLNQRTGPSPELSVILTRLHNKTQETSYLSGWQQGTLVLQHFLPGTQTLTVGARDVGYTGNMHARASCKAPIGAAPP